MTIATPRTSIDSQWTTGWTNIPIGQSGVPVNRSGAAARRFDPKLLGSDIARPCLIEGEVFVRRFVSGTRKRDRWDAGLFKKMYCVSRGAGDW